MKHNRMALLISVLLVLTFAFAGCGKDNGASGGAQTASTARVIGTVSRVYLEKDDGDANIDVTDKDTLKEIRATMNGLKEAKDATAPENEELYVYLEWDDGGENSKYAFVYHMADGSSLVEVSESNSDNPPVYYTGETAYNDLAAIIDKAAQ